MEKSNVLKFRKKLRPSRRQGLHLREWKTAEVQPPKPSVSLVAVDVATLLYNVLQTQREMSEHMEEMADMIEHMEYQIDQLTRLRPREYPEGS